MEVTASVHAALTKRMHQHDTVSGIVGWTSRNGRRRPFCVRPAEGLVFIPITAQSHPQFVQLTGVFIGRGVDVLTLGDEANGVAQWQAVLQNLLERIQIMPVHDQQFVLVELNL